jgi:hypothetical protein
VESKRSKYDNFLLEMNMLSFHDFNGKLIIFRTEHTNFAPYFTRTVTVIAVFPDQC